MDQQPPPIPSGRPSPPPIPKQKSGNRALIIVLSILIGGIALVAVLAGIFVPKIAKQVSKPKVVVSSDGQLSLSVPGLWTELKELHENGELRYGNKYAETYIVVISDAKEDLDEEMTLASHSAITREKITSSITGGSATEPTDLKINGSDALQCEIFGEVDNIEIAYVHTTVEDETHFHQVLAWTLKSHYPKNKEELKKVVSSFKTKAPKLTQVEN